MNMEIPTNLKYAQTHEWARVEGDVVVVGITDFAQKQLGDIVFIELPAIGKKVKQAENLGTIESAKAVGELLSPVSGEVIEVNKAVEGDPAVVNSAPYENGWLVKLKVGNAADLDKLLTPAQYAEIAK